MTIHFGIPIFVEAAVGVYVASVVAQAWFTWRAWRSPRRRSWL